MLTVAFSLGILGSLHCIGMCGPLAIAFTNKRRNNRWLTILDIMAYNLGRTLTYTLLGLLFGLIGQMVLLAGAQQFLSIILGCFLILSFMISYNWENALRKNSFFNKLFSFLNKYLHKILKSSEKIPSLVLGMTNGFLPCGLVYVALTGALAAGSMIEGGLFMAFFGLGTIPAMFALVVGWNNFPQRIRSSLRSIFPVTSLIFGIFLIYRGVMVEFPEELNFWEAIKNPMMCH